jgi:hypothetical protein
MANYYDYRYYIDGRNIAILQNAQDISYDPYIDYGDELYVTPQTSDSSGILLKYTVVISAPSDEETAIGVDRFLARAIVYYVKAKLVEDTDKRLFEWNMREFNKLVQRQRRRKIGSPRINSPNYTGVIR